MENSTPVAYQCSGCRGIYPLHGSGHICGTPAIRDGVVTTNPKDLIGSKKVSLTKIPPVALAHCAAAMMDGADKYEPYNWREKKIQAGIYIDAALRHLWAWFDREEEAQDSHVHHLGHAMACCAILIDAQAGGCLVDTRPQGEGAYRRVAKEIQSRLEAKG